VVDGLRLLGAAYLIWLGWKLLRTPDAIAEPRKLQRPRGRYFLQAFLVCWAISRRCCLRLIGGGACLAFSRQR